MDIVYVFADKELNENECRFEIPEARIRDKELLHSKGRDYAILPFSHHPLPIPVLRCVGLRVNNELSNRVTVFIDQSTASEMGFDISGDTCYVMPV